MEPLMVRFSKTLLPQPGDVLVDIGGGELPGELAALPDQAPPGEQDMLDRTHLTMLLTLLNPSIESPAPFAEATGGGAVGIGGGIAEVKIE